MPGRFHFWTVLDFRALRTTAASVAVADSILPLTNGSNRPEAVIEALN